jgi:hypothetical protein
VSGKIEITSLKTEVTMFRILIGLLLIASAETHANCDLVFKKPRGAAMSSSYITDKTYLKIIDILTAKGYEVFAPGEIHGAAYALDVKGYYGYGCGTGLTFFDYLTVPAYNFIEFSGPESTLIQKEKSFSSPLGVRKLAKRHLMSVIQNLPDCL